MCDVVREDRCAMCRREVAFVWSNSSGGFVGVWVTGGVGRLQNHERVRSLARQASTLHPWSIWYILYPFVPVPLPATQSHPLHSRIPTHYAPSFP